jgi:GH25 family lysozyme M1 (1,4-beta-N-acetylmuramidase)
MIRISIPEGTVSGEYAISRVGPTPIPVTPPPVPTISPLVAGDEGVDVSSHNGVVTYSKVKDAGMRVVIVRTSMGATGVDTMGAVNLKNAKAAGIDYVSSYHLGIRGTDPARNVENVLKHSNALESNYRLTFDLEPLSHEIASFNKRGGFTPPDISSANAANMQRTLYALRDALGYAPIVYCNEYALTVLGMQNSDWLAEFPGHFAAYNRSKKVHVPGPWQRKANSKWYCHQYDAGDMPWSIKVPGFPGRADRNVYSGLVLA